MMRKPRVKRRPVAIIIDRPVPTKTNPKCHIAFGVGSLSGAEDASDVCVHHRNAIDVRRQ
jgi:hypothetical protein